MPSGRRVSQALQLILSGLQMLWACADNGHLQAGAEKFFCDREADVSGAPRHHRGAVAECEDVTVHHVLPL